MKIIKKPLNTLTWNKDDKYITIERFMHETVTINRETGKTEWIIRQVPKIPPTKRKHK